MTAICSNLHYVLISLYKSRLIVFVYLDINACFVLCKRYSIINFFCGASCNRYWSRHNLQTAWTNIQAYAVVVILRKICKSEINIIDIIPYIFFINSIIMQTCRIRIISSFCLYRIPDIIKVSLCIFIMADQDIILYIFSWIGKSCQIRFSGIERTCPTVRLHANSDVDLCHF